MVADRVAVQPGDLLLAAHVHGVGDATDVRRRLRGRVRVDVGDDDACTFGSEFLRDGAPDTLAGSGYDGHPILQFHALVSSQRWAACWSSRRRSAAVVVGR